MSRPSTIGLLLTLSCAALAQEQTVGVFVNEPDAQPGYTLIACLESTETYLIDLEGRIVNQWTSEFRPGNSLYLLEDGSLLRTMDPGNGDSTLGTPGVGGIIERRDWEGALLWRFVWDDETHRQHHDIQPMPNGNVLLVSYEWINHEDVLAAGRDPDLLPTDGLYSDEIIEIQPTGPTTGKVVWRWRLWDHLIQDFSPTLPNYGDVATHPERVDVNWEAANTAQRIDWSHVNAVAYNPGLDQIIITTPVFSELWILNHNTTTEEAAGPAGDLLYRWGNPQCYKMGTPEDQVLFGPHDGRWITDNCPGTGNITVFNNGGKQYNRLFSTVEELNPPLTSDGEYELEESGVYGPATFDTILKATPDPTHFYGRFVSGAEKQPNGNVLACAGTLGHFLEQTAQGETVWEYINPATDTERLGPCDSIPLHGSSATANRVFRGPRYPSDFIGFDRRDLTPGAYLVEFPTCAGNLNNDRVVDGADLTILLGGWGRSTYDLDGNGTVDGNDLTILLGAWGACPDC